MLITSAVKEDYVRIESVTKAFDDVYAVDDVSLTIRQGEIFALLGSSGCGKSTLLRMLAGFETPSHGSIRIDGEDMSVVPPYHRPVNMMFQSYALFPHMTVEQNVAFGLKQEGSPKVDRGPGAGTAETGAHGILCAPQTRPAFRRAAAACGAGAQPGKAPQTTVLDEPMGALDKKLREQMQLEVVDIIEGVGVTCVMVTHDQQEAMTMANRVGVMDEGRILQIGTPSQVYETPTSRFTAEFIGSVNLFEGRVVEDEPSYVVIESADLEQRLYIDHGITGTLNMQAWVAVRPEKITLTRKPPEKQYNWLTGHSAGYCLPGQPFDLPCAAVQSGRVVIANVGNLQRNCDDCPTWDDEVCLSWDDNSGVVLTQ